MARLVPQLKRMPIALAALTGVFAACGLILVALALRRQDLADWRRHCCDYWGVCASPCRRALQSPGSGSICASNGSGRHGASVLLSARGRMKVPEMAWIAFLGIVSYWYFFWKRTVVDYFSRRRAAELGAPPNGGPAAPFGNSGVGGPPSVS